MTKGKIIMIENRRIKDNEQLEAKNTLTPNMTVFRKKYYNDGHIKSLRFRGPLQIRHDK